MVHPLLYSFHHHNYYSMGLHLSQVVKAVQKCQCPIFVLVQPHPLLHMDFGPKEAELWIQSPIPMNNHQLRECRFLWEAAVLVATLQREEGLAKVLAPIQGQMENQFPPLEILELKFAPALRIVPVPHYRGHQAHSPVLHIPKVLARVQLLLLLIRWEIIGYTLG